MIGIYKITSPTGRIYIGQSNNSVRRESEYKYLGSGVKSQTKIYRSILKYGWENHIFEVIEECEFEDMNCRERYWQDFYDVLNGGLNCVLVETHTKNKKFSEEVIEKMRKKLTGRRHTVKTKLKMSKAKKGENHPNWGKGLPQKTKDKIRDGNSGKVRSEETKRKISKSKIGKKVSEETKRRMSLSRIGKTTKRIDKLTLEGEYICTYNSLTEAAKDCGGKKAHIPAVAQGRRNSTLGYKWRYNNG